jgi:hypothetical protein
MTKKNKASKKIASKASKLMKPKLTAQCIANAFQRRGETGEHTTAWISHRTLSALINHLPEKKIGKKYIKQVKKHLISNSKSENSVPRLLMAKHRLKGNGSGFTVYPTVTDNSQSIMYCYQDEYASPKSMQLGTSSKVDTNLVQMKAA